MRIPCVLVLALAIGAYAEDYFESTGVKVALKIYDDCSKTEGFSPCLKKKAITFLDRLGKMEKFAITEGVTLVRAKDAPIENSINEEQLDASLPRALEAKDEALTNMLFDKVTNFVSSRSLQVTMPKFSAEDLGIEEGRGKKMKGMMGGMLMGMAAKMAAMIPVAIAGLFLLAGKALITAKIALLLAGIIAIKKLFAAKASGGHGGGHATWQSGGGGGGWQSSGGGWDKRSISEAQKMAYNAYSPKI